MNNKSAEHAFIVKYSILNRRMIDNSVCLGERIASLIEIIIKQDLNFFYTLKISKKQSDESRKFRLEGNQHFQSTASGSLDKAVEKYTKAVAHAPTGSEDLGLAYANRSAALFKAKLFSDCLLDIERALKNDYPDDLKAKLFLRRVMCLQILNSDNDLAIKEAFDETRKWSNKMHETKRRNLNKNLEEQEHATSINKSTFSKWPYKKFIPKLDTENPMIPGLSDAVELQYSKKHGRHMVATRDIKPGEVICVQKAYAQVVDSSSRYYLCWNCGEQTWASVPCEKCVEVVFCSEACREEGNREYHDIECPIISIQFGPIALDYLLLRILVKALKQARGSIETLKSYVQEIDAEKNPRLKGFKNNIFDPNEFASIYSLTSSLNEEAVVKAMAYALLVAFLLAIKTDFFGSTLRVDQKNFTAQNNFIFIVALLKKIIMIINNNQNQAFGLVYGNTPYRMMVPVYSFFNHMCDMMVTTITHGDHLANRANMPIKKGQQIFVNYGPIYNKDSLDVRRKYFFQNYRFFCNCEVCENDWPQKAVHEYSSLGFENNPIVKELFQNTFDNYQKLYNVKKFASSFGSKHGQIHDLEKDIEALAEIIETFYSLGFKSFSYETRSVTAILNNVLLLNGNRYLTLN